MNKVLEQDLNYIADTVSDPGFFRNKCFLVTGGTGLIGSVFLKALAMLNRRYDLNLHVIAVVRDKTRADDILSDVYKLGLDVSYFTGDLTGEDFPDQMESSFPEGFDYIFHAASVTASRTMVERPVETLETALLGTRNILKLAVRKPPLKMIYLSSMEMYGTVEQGMADEHALGYIDLSNVRSCYPEGKRACEVMCKSYASQYGVNVCCARLAQSFGAGISKTENRVFAQFARSAIQNRDIVLHTKGLSEGNYCYLSDVITALFLLFQRGECGEAYNVVNEACHTTIAGMAAMVAHEICGDRISVRYEIPEGVNFGYAPDVRLFLSGKKLQELGWTPTVNLREAFSRLIAYIKENEETEAEK